MPGFNEWAKVPLDFYFRKGMCAPVFPPVKFNGSIDFYPKQIES